MKVEEFNLPKFCTFCNGFELPNHNHMCDDKWAALMLATDLVVELLIREDNKEEGDKT